MPWAIGLAVTAAAGYMSYRQQRKAMESNEEAAKQQNELANLENRQARINAVREARIKRQQMVASASSVGAGSSSGLAGGTSSLASQLGSNIGFANQRQGFATNIMNQQNRATRYENRAGITSAIGSIGNTIFQDLGGYSNIFDTKQKFQ